MSILTHGSDLRLAPTLRPIVQAGDGTVRTALGRLREAGFAAVQLDATLPGIRPRDLSHRARRDLAALLSRHDAAAAGLDLFIPRRHFVERGHVDRAAAAAAAAIELAADLGRITVSLALPVEQVGDDVKSALAAAADGHSVTLAIHAEDQLDALAAWVAQVDQPTLGIGLDAAALLARCADPAATAQRLGKHITAARLCDVSDAALRCAVGQGQLDVSGYRLSLDLASRRSGPVVLDLRGLEAPLAAAEAGLRAWDAAAVRL